MFTQHLVQRGVQEMGRGVIAHDIVAAAHVHLGQSQVADPWLA